ncbi:MAG: M28 family peptidase [Flavobacteriales bacterium]|nr:M28 family peptidase [Flavobacteriales bacterium]
MKKITLLFTVLFPLLAGHALGQNQEPVISGLYAWADAPNNTLHVYYEVADNEGEDLEIFLGVSGNDTVYAIDVSSATGDIGYPVTPGMGKEIIWNYGVSHPNILNYRVRLTADDRFQIDIQAIVDQVDTMNLIQDLSWISGIRDHNSGLAHLYDVRDSIINRFNSLSLEVSTQAFSYLGDTTGLNVIGRLPGVVEDSITFINDAHYDGVAGAPAADDNGSGVVGFLEAARILAPYNFRKSIRFIGFDMEETQPGGFGLIGSGQYVNSGGIQPWEQIAGVFNYEMIGYYSEKPGTQTFPNLFDIFFPAAYDSMVAADWKGNFITNVATDDAQVLGNQFDSITRAFVPELRVITIYSPGSGSSIPDLRRSDHAWFWTAGIDALLLTDGAEFRNTNYHTPLDVMDSLDFNFMGNNVKAVVANLCVLAGIQHSHVAYVDMSTTPLSVTKNDFINPQLQIFPNPTSGEVLIVLTETLPEIKYLLEITDEAGRVVLKRNRTLNDEGWALDVSKWSAGVYNVTIQGGETSITKSLIVQ